MHPCVNQSNSSTTPTVGLISVLMVMIMGQSRIFLGMSKDGLIPKTFSKVNAETGVPSKNLMILGGVISVVAAFTPINDLAHMTSFGTLFAFTMVCVAVWVLRVNAETGVPSKNLMILDRKSVV